MKLVHPEIERHIIFKENIFTGLIVENKKFFYRLVNDLYAQTEGENGDFVLSHDNTPIEISKNLELIHDFIPFEVNNKNLLNKLSSAFEKVALNENYYSKTQTILAEIQKYFYDIFPEFSVDLECKKLNLSNIIKVVGISVCEEDIPPLEKIFNYMEVIRELEKDKVFAFINMRSFFSYEELNDFVKTALSHKFNFFMLDSYESVCLENEIRLIIDEDLCEI